MIAIIVVCVGFLLFMIILGVFRIRATHNRRRVVQVDDRQEMEWDNSELNITVNPIDQEVGIHIDNFCVFGHQHFLLFPKCFQKVSFQGS